MAMPQVQPGSGKGKATTIPHHPCLKLPLEGKAKPGPLFLLYPTSASSIVKQARKSKVWTVLGTLDGSGVEMLWAYSHLALSPGIGVM